PRRRRQRDQVANERLRGGPPPPSPNPRHRGVPVPRHARVPAPELSEGDEDRARLRLGPERPSAPGAARATHRDSTPTAAGGPMTAAAKIRTGIAGLDKMLHGGFVTGRPYIVSGPNGAGKTIHAMQLIIEDLESEVG